MRQSGMEGPRSQRPLRPGRGLDLEAGDYCRRVSGRGGHSQICELLSEDGLEDWEMLETAPRERGQGLAGAAAEVTQGGVRTGKARPQQCPQGMFPCVGWIPHKVSSVWVLREVQGQLETVHDRPQN